MPNPTSSWLAGCLLLAAVLAIQACADRESDVSAPAPTAIEAADTLAASALTTRQVPGLALVVLRGDEPVLARGYGHLEVGHADPVTADTLFQLGSISKQFLAALVVALEVDGTLSLDDPVVRHLPDFAHLPASIRVRHLLQHASGLREIFTDPEAQAAYDDLTRGREGFENVIRRLPADFPPGSRWSYSNTNYSLLALLAERLTGKPYEQALAERFFTPLRLTSLRHCASVPQGSREARGHERREGAIIVAAPENMNWIRGDGGLCGSAFDVARWTRLLATGRVVPPGAYATMIVPASLADGREAEYGMGLSLVSPDGRRRIGHNGAMRGFSASAAYYPTDGLTVVVLANRGDVRTEAIERQVARRLLALPEPALQARELSPRDRARFVGTYDIGVFDIEVVDRAGQLWLQMPRPGPTTPLRYLGDGRFVGADDPDAYGLTFDASEGSAERVRLFMAAMHWYGVRKPDTGSRIPAS